MNDTVFYRLEGLTPVRCSRTQWRLMYMFGGRRRLVDSTDLDGPDGLVEVRTTFIGLDVPGAVSSPGVPYLWRTSCLGGPGRFAEDYWAECSYGRARRQHWRIVDQLVGLGCTIRGLSIADARRWG